MQTPEISRRGAVLGLLSGLGLSALANPTLSSERVVEESLEGFLWCLGVLQPISPMELERFLTRLGALAKVSLPAFFVRDSLKLSRQRRFVGSFLIGAKRQYSLSYHGNLRLSRDLRILRDLSRLRLLAGSSTLTITEPWDGWTSRLVGDSPTLELVGQLLNNSGIANTVANTWAARWAGKLKPSQGLLDVPEYLSYNSLQDLRRHSLTAKSERFEANEGKITTAQISIALGLSTNLLKGYSSSLYGNYRRISIRKSSGGMRLLQVPDWKLATIQKTLRRFFLNRLYVHESVHSYIPKTRNAELKNFATNAGVHRGQQFIGKLDIVDFFGSVTQSSVAETLESLNFSKEAARTISGLCTTSKPGSRKAVFFLPQGASTSPVLSNIAMAGVDETIASFCQQEQLKYSRYSDDITISGNSRIGVLRGLQRVEKVLSTFNYVSNVQKRVILGPSDRRYVTGCVVGQKILPPRQSRRKIRAAFHLLQSGQEVDRSKLAGYLGYLNSFPDLTGGREVLAYKRLLNP